MERLLVMLFKNQSWNYFCLITFTNNLGARIIGLLLKAVENTVQKIKCFGGLD